MGARESSPAGWGDSVAEDTLPDDHAAPLSRRPGGSVLSASLPDGPAGGETGITSHRPLVCQSPAPPPASPLDGRRLGDHPAKRRGVLGGWLRRAGSGALTVGVLLALWQGTVQVAGLPGYILPSPAAVLAVFANQGERLVAEAAVTLLEIGLGLVLGVFVGIVTGLGIAVSPLAGRIVTPVLVASQALPVFALAPLLVIWLGFGLASKVVMAALIIYFPVASALADGLQRTEPGLLDLARLAGAGRLRTLALIRLPSALPALVTGIRVAAVFAPIGAVIGEWVGASRGLGLLMVQANARMQTDLLFAALVILAAMALVLQAATKAATARLIPWAEETEPRGRD